MPDPILPPFRGTWLTPREAVDHKYNTLFSHSIFSRLEMVGGMLRRKTFDPDDLKWIDFCLKMQERNLRAREGRSESDD